MDQMLYCSVVRPLLVCWLRRFRAATTSRCSIRRCFMSRRLWAVLGVLAGTAAVLLVVGLRVFPAPALAQRVAQAPAATPAELPPGYVGSETCKGCHAEQWNKFSKTKMGRLFLHQPRN